MVQFRLGLKDLLSILDFLLGGLSRNPRKFRRSSFSPSEALRHRAGQSFARMTGARLLQPVGRAVQLRQISLEDTTPQRTIFRFLQRPRQAHHDAYI